MIVELGNLFLVVGQVLLFVHLVNTGQLDVELCINMNPSTQYAILKDVVDVLLRPDVDSYASLDFRDLDTPVQAGVQEAERYVASSSIGPEVGARDEAELHLRVLPREADEDSER